MCVQSLDDSRGFAIRITYRISLRSSSLWEPRHPLLKVVRHLNFGSILAKRQDQNSLYPALDLTLWLHDSFYPLALPNSVHYALHSVVHSHIQRLRCTCFKGGSILLQTNTYIHVNICQQSYLAFQIHRKSNIDTDQLHLLRCGNDPSAGSPTETLLRLHLPLNDKV